MLLKRILIAVLCLCILSGGVYFGVTYRFFDRPLSAKAQEEFRETIALPENFTLAASAVSTDAAKNSLQSVRKAVESGAYAVELNIAFDAKGVPYLADGEDYITDSSVSLETVLQAMAKRETLRYILVLHNFDSAQQLLELLQTYSSADRVILCGFTLDTLPEVRHLYSNFKLCVDVDTSFGSFKDADTCDTLRRKAYNAGAAYVRCGVQDVTETLSEALKIGETLGLILEGVQTEYDMYYALSLNPKVIVTDRPGEMYAFLYAHNYLDARMENQF